MQDGEITLSITDYISSENPSTNIEIMSRNVGGWGREWKKVGEKHEGGEEKKGKPRGLTKRDGGRVNSIGNFLVVNSDRITIIMLVNSSGRYHVFVSL